MRYVPLTGDGFTKLCDRTRTTAVFNAARNWLLPLSLSLRSWFFWLHIYFRLIWVCCLCVRPISNGNICLNFFKSVCASVRVYRALRCVLFKCLDLFLFLLAMWLCVSFLRNFVHSLILFCCFFSFFSSLIRFISIPNVLSILNAFQKAKLNVHCNGPLLSPR